MKFTLQHTDPKSKARVASLTTDHGVIETPIFMPVGTAATVKGVHQRDLKQEINTTFDPLKQSVEELSENIKNSSKGSRLFFWKK